MSETQLSKSIRGALEAAGVWNQRVNSGKLLASSGGRSYMVQLAPKGTPDILVLSPYGWLEVKRPGEKLSADQVAWHARAERERVRSAVVHSIEEALMQVSLWKVADEAKGPGLRVVR